MRNCFNFPPRGELLGATTVMLALFLSGCGEAEAPATAKASAAASSNAEASNDAGSIKIGATTWQLIPSIQCSVYPGGVISVAGHAAGDPDLEIVIDFGGPTGMRIGPENSTDTWRASANTLQIDIDGTSFTGTADFFKGAGANISKERGSFDIRC